MWLIWCVTCCLVIPFVKALPEDLIYPYDVPEAKYLAQEDDVSSNEVKLMMPIVFFGVTYESIFVHSNGFLSFQTDIPQFINIEFPLDYPIIAPFYSNVDLRKAGKVSYYETEDPDILQRATENVHEAFLNYADFQATNIFIATWKGVGYFNQGYDKVNTYQIALYTDGLQTYVEFLYPEGGLQWIQGTGDQSGLPDARAQAGIISPEGKVMRLPGSGSEQVRSLEKWSNMGLDGQFLYRIDEPEVIEPDVNFDNKHSGPPQSCADATTDCHVQATCIDYEEGFCCKCKPKYYGNGKFCVKKDLPLRVNGKVNGKINGEKLDGLDLQSYIAMAEGRAYTAISKIPTSIDCDIQSLQVLGGTIGYLFAKPIREAHNGYQLTGGVFNSTAVITFLNTSQTVRIRQKYLGLDVFDMLRLEIDIQGDIPILPRDAKVNIDEYEEQYTLTSPGVIQMSSPRIFWYTTPSGERAVTHFNLEQTFVFDYCKFDNFSTGETWRLKVGKNFISYESREQIIRFGLSGKIVPQGDYDPCEEGRSQCAENSACVVENDSFRCVCNVGFQRVFNGQSEVCADVNECQTGLHECDYNAKCLNSVGSYTCQCYPGFEGDGHICVSAKSCENVTCNENAECFENNGAVSCRCMRGFQANGQYCDPILDHSCHLANNCSPFGLCTISPETNAYRCECLPNYVGDGYTCERDQRPTTTIETPTTVTEPAREGERVPQTCQSDDCWCPPGYIIEEGTRYCLPTDDVTNPLPITTDFSSCDVTNNCHKDATCLYSDDSHSYQCICNHGFEGSGYVCEKQFLSCTIEDNCSPQATCTYDVSLGKSKCVCNPGFVGDGYNCSIRAMCIDNRDCTATEECAYSNPNRRECVCKEGHVRDTQHQCVAIQGTCGGGRCVENAECIFDDDVETFYCTCKEGYVGNGITECRVKPVGCDTLNNCGEHATCQYDEEDITYKCECKAGFYGDGYQCFAERNCQTDPGLCDKNAACYSDAQRRFSCQCNSGYIGNGTFCREISHYEGNFLLVNQGMATLRINIDNAKKNQKKLIQVKAMQTAIGLDIDCLEGRAYWSDIHGRKIRSTLFNGTGMADFITNGIGSPEGLAIDWVSRNMFWTDSTQRTIEVANLDSKLRRVLFRDGLVNPRGIAVHPQRGKIFWSDWYRSHPKIEWANADGTGRETFIEGKDVSLPNSLTIDYDTDQLCYADAGTKKIECVHIDSKEKQTIAVNCTYPFGIAVTDKQIYWSDWISKHIERVDKYNLKRLPPLPVPLGGSGNKLYGLVAVANSCPQLTNVCQYNRNQCPKDHICLLNGSGGRRCLCAFRSDKPDEQPSCVL